MSGTTHAPFNLKAALKEITPALRVLLVLTALVSAARCSNAFLLLRAADTGIPAAAVPLIIVGLNAVFSLSAYPFGKLADTVSESLLLVTGLIFLAAGNLFLAWVPSTAGIAAGIIFWGLHMGAVQGVMSKLTASAAGPGNRATAFGLASFTAGITLLAANTVFGVLWSAAGAAVSFTIGALFAVVAVISALRLKKTLSQNRATKVP